MAIEDVKIKMKVHILLRTLKYTILKVNISSFFKCRPHALLSAQTLNLRETSDVSLK